MGGALEGIVVLDLTRVLAGPYCGMLLGDLGAEVIKIEVPGRGDDARQYPPFKNDESFYFISVNRNKKGITLNLKSQEGKEIFKKMVKSADVVLENYRPGTMKKLGLDYDVLKEINPRLIYAAISGFGQDGPYASKPGYDLIAQAMGGVMGLTAHPGGMPTRVGSAIGDIVAGIMCSVGILAALQARTTTGKGQYVDISMLDAQVAILENAIARYSATGKSPEPTGNRHPSITPFQAFPTKDYYVICAAGNDKLWAEFCQALGKDELIDDPRFKTNPLRTENVAQLEEILFDVFRQKTTQEWIEVFDKAKIPCGPVYLIEQVAHDPQVLARKMVREVEHPVAGKLLTHGVPIKMSETPGDIWSMAPVLGQNNEEVFQKYAGIKPEELEALHKDGVI